VASLRTVLIVANVAAVLLGSSRDASAQLKGHCIPGFTGLDNGTQKSRMESASLDVPSSFAFTNIYIQPLWLGWHTPRAEYTMGWAFFAPGKCESGGTARRG